MSDVEENNFEGRVSTKPREPSSATARCSGFHRGRRGRGEFCGSPRGGGAASGAVTVASSPPKMASGFPSCPQTPRAALSPFFWGGGGRLTDTRTPESDLRTQRALPSRHHPPPRGVGPRGGGAGGAGGELPSGRTAVGASCGGLAGDPERRRGSRGRKCAGLPSGRD